MARGDRYRIRRLGAKPSERFPAVLSKVDEQHSGGETELDENPHEPGDDDRDPVIS